MGFHVCEYLKDRAEGEQLGLRNLDAFHSSGDVTLCYDSGRSWVMPDMARLYVELGWVPPAAFIEDVMRGKVVEGARRQTRGAAPRPQPIGYLNPEDNPLPRPFAVNPSLPAGFLEKLEGHMKEAEAMGYRGKTWTGHGFTDSIPTGRRQTKGFKPGG